MSRVDWDKARRDLRRAEANRARSGADTAARWLRDEGTRREAATKFAREHELACFKCGEDSGPFARARRERNGRRWALCVRCFGRTTRK